MIKIERILCPTDSMPESDSALRYALALAHRFKAKLFVCHCVEPIVNDTDRREIRQRIEEAIKTHTGVEQTAPTEIDRAVLDGDPDDIIPAAAAEWNIDLIVMRSRQRPVAAMLLGSTAEAVCRQAPCPILVVHPHERQWVRMPGGEVELDRILAAHDFSSDSEAALNIARSFAEEFGSELHLLHILPEAIADASSGLPPGMGSVFERTEKMLQQAVSDEQQSRCNTIRTVRSGQPGSEIPAYARQFKIDLICMGIRGERVRLEKLFGSNTDRVLRHSPCPVLITKA